MNAVNFLEKLLDGVAVEWLPLGEVGELIRGNGLQKKDFVESGFPAIHYGQIYTRYGLSAEKTFTYVSDQLAGKLRVANKNDLLLATTSENDEDVVKPLAWLGDKAAISGDMMLFRHAQNVKYLAYFFKTEKFQEQKKKYITGAKVRRVSGGDLSKILVPIPCPDNPKKSLEIQAEIVRILDAFTAVTSELTSELTARKQQYNYYRDQLLNFTTPPCGHPSKGGELNSPSLKGWQAQPDGVVAVEWKQLKNLTCKTQNINWNTIENTYQYIDLSSVCIESRCIVQTTEIDSSNAPSRAQKIVKKNDVIFATTRPTQLRIFSIPSDLDGAIASTGYCVLRANPKEVLPKWIYHCLTTSRFKCYLEENESGSAYPAISDAKLKEYSIPIPPLNEQARIVAILDKFDALTNSITEGLPREIELRQKQYAYYRDLLLSFPQFPSSGGVAGAA